MLIWVLKYSGNTAPTGNSQAGALPWGVLKAKWNRNWGHVYFQPWGLNSPRRRRGPLRCAARVIKRLIKCLLFRFPARRCLVVVVQPVFEDDYVGHIGSIVWSIRVRGMFMHDLRGWFWRAWKGGVDGRENCWAKSYCRCSSRVSSEHLGERKGLGMT